MKLGTSLLVDSFFFYFFFIYLFFSPKVLTPRVFKIEGTISIVDSLIEIQCYGHDHHKYDLMTMNINHITS